MSDNLKQREPEVQQQVEAGQTLGGTGESPPETIAGMIKCTHGVHEGEFNMIGKTVKEARTELTPLLNLAPDAIVVARGEILADNEVISEKHVALHWVREAAVKGL